MAYCFDFSSGSGSVTISSELTFQSLAGASYVGAWVKMPAADSVQTAILFSTFNGVMLSVSPTNALYVLILNPQTNALSMCLSMDTTVIMDGTWHYVGFAIDHNTSYVSFVKGSKVVDTQPVTLYHGPWEGWGGLTPAFYNNAGNASLIAFGNLDGCNTPSFPGQVGYFFSMGVSCDEGNVYETLAAGVEAGPLQYWNCVVMQNQIGTDSLIDTMCPLLGCLGAQQLASVNTQTPITLSDPSLLIYSGDTYWDGYTELWLSAPSAPFPVFTADQMAAFGYMMTCLRMPGETLATLRAMYSNQAQNLSMYWDTLSSLQYAQISDPAFTQADFDIVQTQICMELFAANALQQYYSAALQTYNLMYLDNLAQMTYVGSGLNQDQVTIPNASPIGGDITDAVTLMAGAMSMAGYGGAGNGLKALWTVLNTQMTPTLPPDLYGPYSAAYTNLVDTVQDNWTNAIDNFSQQVTAMVQNNGQLTVCSQLVLGNYLQWDFAENVVPPQVITANQEYYAEVLMTSVYDQAEFYCQSGNNTPTGPCCPCPPYDARFTTVSGSDFFIIGVYDQVTASITAVPGSGAGDFLFNTMNLSNSDVVLNWDWEQADEECPTC